jgi:hypothetical protein
VARNAGVVGTVYLRGFKIPYYFVEVPTLLADFMKDVQEVQP